MLVYYEEDQVTPGSGAGGMSLCVLCTPQTPQPPETKYKPDAGPK